MKHKFMTLETVVFPHLIIFSFFNKTFHQKKRDAIHHKNMPYQIKQKIWCNLHIFTKNFLSLIKMLRSIHSFHKEPLLLLLPFQKKRISNSWEYPDPSSTQIVYAKMGNTMQQSSTFFKVFVAEKSIDRVATFCFFTCYSHFPLLPWDLNKHYTLALMLHLSCSFRRKRGTIIPVKNSKKGGQTNGCPKPLNKVPILFNDDRERGHCSLKRLKDMFTQG